MESHLRGGTDMSSEIFRSSVPHQFIAESCTLRMDLAGSLHGVDQDKL